MWKTCGKFGVLPIINLSKRMLKNIGIWVGIGIFFLVVIGNSLNGNETDVQKKERCDGYFERINVNHENARAIIPADDLDFCLDYWHALKKVK